TVGIPAAGCGNFRILPESSPSGLTLAFQLRTSRPSMSEARWKDRFRLRSVDARKAVAGIRRGCRVFVGSGCAEPVLLVSALAERDDLADVEVLHIMTIGQAPYARAAQAGRFRHNAFFIGSNVREAVASGQADYTPVFLSEIPALFRSRRLPLDIALISATPPDAHGYCSLG